VKIACVIVDDEPLARLRLRDHVREVAWLELVGEAADGPEAIRAIDAKRPDIVFLDIELPGLSGLEVLERTRHRPAVIFTTAFDRYAVAAFELMALDYLLKPFGRERFELAIQRVRQGLDLLVAPGHGLERARQALSGGEALRRLFVRERGRIVPIALREIERIEAQDDYVLVHAAGRRHLIHVTLRDLERRLDPERFLRVHRSHLVNVDHVAELRRGANGRLEVRMRDGTGLLASRERSRALRRLAL
jgi:two-component system LytT family response regulator